MADTATSFGTRKVKAEPEEGTEIKKPKSPRRKKPKVNFSFEELQEKFSRTFNAFAFFLKVEKVYIPEDFEEEAKDMVRLAEKYPALSALLTFLDPLFLVLGLFSKFRELADKVKVRKNQERQARYDTEGQEVEVAMDAWRQ